MADLEGLKVAKDYHIDTPFANQDGFYVKGANSLDWGMIWNYQSTGCCRIPPLVSFPEYKILNRRSHPAFSAEE